MTHVHLVDLVKSFHASTYLQNLASIQPITVLSILLKFTSSQKLETTIRAKSTNIGNHPLVDKLGCWVRFIVHSERDSLDTEGGQFFDANSVCFDSDDLRS